MEDRNEPSHYGRLGREEIKGLASVDRIGSNVATHSSWAAVPPPVYARMPSASPADTTNSSKALSPNSDPSSFHSDNVGKMKTGRPFDLETYRKSANDSTGYHTGSRTSAAPSDSDNSISSLSVESTTKNNEDLETGRKSPRTEMGYESKQRQRLAQSSEVQAKKNRHAESTELKRGDEDERAANSGKRKFDLSKNTLSREGGETSLFVRSDDNKLSPKPGAATQASNNSNASDYQRTGSSSSGDAGGSKVKNGHAVSESGSGDNSKPTSFAGLDGKSDPITSKEAKFVQHRPQPPPKKRKFSQTKDPIPEIEIPQQHASMAHPSSDGAEGQRNVAGAQEDEGARLEAKRGYNRMNAARARKRFKDRIDELQRRVEIYRQDVSGLKRSNDELEGRLTELKGENEELVNNFQRLEATMSNPTRDPIVDATLHTSSSALAPTPSPSTSQPSTCHFPAAQTAPSQAPVAQVPSQPNPLLATLLGRLMAAATQNGKQVPTGQNPPPAQVDSAHPLLRQIASSAVQRGPNSVPMSLPGSLTPHTVRPSPVPAATHPQSALLLNLICAMQKTQATQQLQHSQLQQPSQHHSIPPARPKEQDRTQQTAQMLQLALAQNPALLLQLLQGRFHSSGN